MIPKVSGSGFSIPEEEGVPGNSLAAAPSETYVGVQALKLGSSRHTLPGVAVRFKNVPGSHVKHTWVCVIGPFWGIQMNFSYECDPFWTMLCATRI